MKNSYSKIFLILMFSICFQLGKSAEYYVSTTGSDSNPGTKDLPFLTPNKAVDVVQPGDYIYLRGGTYYLTASIKLTAKHCARADARIYMFGYPGEQAIIDGSNIPTSTEQEFKMARCIYVNHEANYWHFKNLELCNAKDNGMKLEGSYTIVENCKFYDNNDTGLQLGMYKDFKIEDTKSLPAGSPEFNPGFQFCRNNVVINCDAYYNYDSKLYNGSNDDGGDADGFACKLFPGPGNEFHGCRAWNNSDDNWDLYMVYHPIVIENCWSYKAGYLKDDKACGNGNGFKLGGGGSAGGLGFDQSVGAHVVRNCVAFESYHKGFDQNNAQEGMYLFNNLSFNNEYNYRFPTVFDYGGMYMRNNIGFNASKENHEFLSEGKDGSQVPNTDYNSWTLLDGCSPYKESTKVLINGKNTTVKTKDYTNEFKSLSPDLFKESRQIDGSLPDNDFAKIKDNSVFVDKGQIIENLEPKTSIPADKLPVDYVILPNITIDYNGNSTDMGAFESGIPTKATLRLISGNTEQLVYTGTAITPIVYKWGGAATDVTVESLPEGMSEAKDMDSKTITISGNPTATGSYIIKTIGGENVIEQTGTISVSTIEPGTLTCITNNLNQIVNIGSAAKDIVIEWGGGATDIEILGLPEGLTADKLNNQLTISGIPETDGSFVINTIGGMIPLSLTGSITRVVPVKVLTGDWYPITTVYADRHEDLQGSIVSLSSDANTVWNPAYKESNGSAMPFGHEGAIDLGKSGGYIMFELPSLAELKINLHTTGNRTVDIYYGKPGTPESTWTKKSLSSFSKTTASGWDIMAQGGISPTEEPIAVKMVNTASGGGMRIYDLYIKVYGNKTPTNINNPTQEKVSFNMYQTETAFIAYGDIASIKIFDLSGHLVAQSTMSQVINTTGLNRGVYIVQIIDFHGNKETLKTMKK